MNENISAARENAAPDKRLRNALIRVVAALVLAAVLFAIPGFSIIDLLRGPAETLDIQTEEPGAFVATEVYAILGFYSEKDGEADRYAVIPVGEKLFSVRFTDRYLASAQAVCDSTYDLLSGTSGELDAYVSVQGTVGALKENASGRMYDWFDLNYDQLLEMGMIYETDDYADYLSDAVLVVDTVKGYHQNLIVTLSLLAAALLLYMLAELVLMATGFYLPKREKAEDTAEDGDIATLLNRYGGVESAQPEEISLEDAPGPEEEKTGGDDGEGLAESEEDDGEMPGPGSEDGSGSEDGRDGSGESDPGGEKEED